jgi:hypothetical protein
VAESLLRFYYVPDRLKAELQTGAISKRPPCYKSLKLALAFAPAV